MCDIIGLWRWSGLALSDVLGCPRGAGVQVRAGLCSPSPALDSPTLWSRPPGHVILLCVCRRAAWALVATDSCWRTLAFFPGLCSCLHITLHTVILIQNKGTFLPLQETFGPSLNLGSVSRH